MKGERAEKGVRVREGEGGEGKRRVKGEREGEGG